MALKEFMQTLGTMGSAFFLFIIGINIISVGLNPLYPQPNLVMIGGAMTLASIAVTCYFFIYHRYFRFQNYIFLELLVRTGAREERSIRLAVREDEIEGHPIKETDIARGDEIGVLARQVDAIGAAYRRQIQAFLAQTGERKLYWIKVRGIDMLDNPGEEKEIVFGTTVPLLQHGTPIVDDIFVMNYPAKVRRMFLEGILLSRASIDRIEVTRKRKLLGLFSKLKPQPNGGQPYYLVSTELPVILITGSCHIAEKQYQGVFGIPVWADHKIAVQALQEIRDKAVEHYFDLRSEAEKMLLRHNLALRDILNRGFPTEVITRGMETFSEEEVRRESRSKIGIILLASVAAFLLVLVLFSWLGGA